MTTTTVTIDLVHTADDDHILTAYVGSDPVCSLVDSGDGWEVVEGQDGERLESLADVIADDTSERWFESVHRKMYELAETIE